MLNIVLPIAGRGSRFAIAGYTLPKPLIPIHGIPMIEIVMRNVRPLQPHRCVFLALAEHLRETAIRDLIDRAAPGSVVIDVQGVTEGAACTVLLARHVINNDDPLMIANSDQYVDADINDYLEYMDRCELDGLIMTFQSNDPKWSYARLDASGKVLEVVEKRVVSKHATVGIYLFRRGRDFVQAADEMIARNLRVNNEFYVAPAYNQFIQHGGRVGTWDVGSEGNGMYGLGIPEDLEQFLTNEISRRALRLNPVR